jgi:predicted TIM-barrel fold metal-dependent hydrolase
VIHSLNQWIHDTWTFDYEGRIFTTPVITLGLVDKAIEELEWCVERGAKAVLIRPAPAWGYRGPRSPGLPEFDPFWAKVIEHDVLVAMHSSDSGYDRYQNEWMGSDSEMLPFQPQAFRMLSQWRPVEDAVSALICHGALSRFPTLKLAVIENGSSWVEPLLKVLADTYKKMPQDFPEDPIVVFKRNIHVSPFWEEDLVELAELIGEDHVLFGSDFPHPEGLAEPATYVQQLNGASEELVRKIMGGNLARLMNVDAKVLR